MVDSNQNLYQKIDLGHSQIILREDGILELHADDNHIYEIEDVKENVAAFGKLSKYKKIPVLIIGGYFTTIKKETRIFMASAESLKYSKAEAFLLKSLAQKILINFYIRVDKPLVPTRVFTDKQKAIDWLKEFL